MTSGRELEDWITGYLQYTEDTEPPRAYHAWVAVSCIAGALQRRVFLSWGIEKIYPNLYIILVGPSGRTRRSTALGIGQDIFEELNIPMTAQAITREALIRKLADSTATYDMRQQGKIGYQAALTTFSSELAVFLGQTDIRFLALLTDWYDSLHSWKYETKHQGKDEIKNLCYNFLGTTAPEWITSMLPLEAIGGGFTARIIFVLEHNKAKLVPRQRFLKEHGILRTALVKDLQRIALLSGEVEFGREAEAAYIDWYTLQDQMLAKGLPPIKDRRFASYCERRQTHLRKLCLTMTASRGNSMKVSLKDFDRARALLELAEKNMPVVFGGLGSASTGQAAYAVLNYLGKVKTAKRSEIIRRFYQDIDFTTLMAVQDTLEYMKAITVVMDPLQKDATYTIIEDKEPTPPLPES